MKYKKDIFLSIFFLIYLITNEPFRVLFLYEIMCGWCL
jgi:hypothetical protein